MNLNGTQIAWLILAGLFTLACIIGMVIFVTRRDFRITIGVPTPEQARVKYSEAEKAIEAETEARKHEVANASLQENVALARAIASRGKLRK